ncbi:hypothetical protein LDC_1626 [sediment metagenome]|uniref:Uncharacterized protein n=1 Tax=sediment metagenome TaxID=749907 RepID=D9PJB7_9ZZZZ
MKGKMRVYYDEEGDYLEIRVGEQSENYGEEISDDVTIFKDETTDEVVGIGILNFKKKAKSSINNLEIDLPIDIGLFARTIE